MKKTVLLIGLILVVLCGVFAQVPAELVGKTYYYEYVETVDEKTGVKRKDTSSFVIGPDDGNTFITFTKTGCYISDKNGYQKNSHYESYEMYGKIFAGEVFNYQGVENNLIIFKTEGTGYCAFFFSKDFNRMNRRWHYGENSFLSYSENAKLNNTWHPYIYVYKRIEYEDPPKNPDKLW